MELISSTFMLTSWSPQPCCSLSTCCFKKSTVCISTDKWLWVKGLVTGNGTMSPTSYSWWMQAHLQDGHVLTSFDPSAPMPHISGFWWMNCPPVSEKSATNLGIFLVSFFLRYDWTSWLLGSQNNQRWDTAITGSHLCVIQGIVQTKNKTWMVKTTGFRQW